MNVCLSSWDRDMFAPSLERVVRTVIAMESAMVPWTIPVSFGVPAPHAPMKASSISDFLRTKKKSRT